MSAGTDVYEPDLIVLVPESLRRADGRVWLGSWTGRGARKREPALEVIEVEAMDADGLLEMETAGDAA